MSKKRYMFDCPVHGQETTVHCFRAFDERHLNRWSTFKIVPDGKMSDADAREHIRSMNADMRDAPLTPYGMLALPEQDA